MVTYDFFCQDCDLQFEARMDVAEYSKGVRPECPGCHSANVIRTFTTFNVFTSHSPPRTPQGCCGPARGPGCCG